MDQLADTRPATERVLAVDLDGTLVRSDMLYESFWAAMAQDWRTPWIALRGLSGGKAVLKARLAAVKRQSSNYLIHEYLHEGWHPLWHSEVLKEVGTAGLSFVGSASLAETLLPGALPPALRATIEDQAAETLRMDVQDLVINQSFRRDTSSAPYSTPCPRPTLRRWMRCGCI